MLRYLAIALVALFTLSVTPVMTMAAGETAAGETAPVKEKKMKHKKGKKKEMDMKTDKAQ
ncbi:MAG: hypothetical protein ORN98_01155 [Alphaproteobacteria bacterium]|nr:hypothetical protein [Alphaproteobacteria bacterium]